MVQYGPGCTPYHHRDVSLLAASKVGELGAAPISRVLRRATTGHIATLTGGVDRRRPTQDYPSMSFV
jgi:hypothetical protein